jgi:hypothetical protein
MVGAGDSRWFDILSADHFDQRRRLLRVNNGLACGHRMGYVCGRAALVPFAELDASFIGKARATRVAGNPVETSLVEQDGIVLRG